MTEQNAVSLLVRASEIPTRPGFVERQFAGATPQDKVREVYSFAHDLGLRPEQTLVRIFNHGLLARMRTYGTDRAGLDEIDTRKFSHPKDKTNSLKLTDLGLRIEDTIYAFPLSRWPRHYQEKPFQEERHLHIPPERAAIALYNGDLLSGIDSPYETATSMASSRITSAECFFFLDPQNKTQALQGILLQAPHPLEVALMGQPNTNAKINYLDTLLTAVTSDNYRLIRDLLWDVERDLAFAIFQNPTNVSLQKQASQVTSLFTRYQPTFTKFHDDELNAQAKREVTLYKR